MRLFFTIGDVRVNVSSSGGIRVGGKLDGAYLSQQVIKPAKRSKKK